MDSLQAKEKPPPNGGKELNAADPFASDIFAVPKPVETPPAPKNEKREPPLRLPKVSRPTVDWNALRRNLPADFSEELPSRLAKAMAKYLNFDGVNQIEFFLLTERETTEMPETDGSWWLRIGIETSDAEFAVQIDEVFAVWLIDAMLGEKFNERVPVRSLTTSEVAVLEFLAVSLTSEANKIISAPLFIFRGFSRRSPVWTNEKNDDDSEISLLVSNWQTVHGLLQSIVRVYLNSNALKALQPDQNSLLTVAPRRAALWKSIEKRVKKVRARMFLGDVRLSYAEAAGLEIGDVVLPENYGFAVAGGDFSGAAEIFLGDGETVKLSGAFQSNGKESSDEETNADAENLTRRLHSKDVLRFVIERIEELETPQFLEKSMPNEQLESKEPEPLESFEDESVGVPLENLAVTLRVELEAKRLSLAEVGSLRVNQIIELGARATDTVNLLIDNKTVALGELVEIEDRLGVRIVQILR